MKTPLSLSVIFSILVLVRALPGFSDTQSKTLIIKTELPKHVVDLLKLNN